MVLSVLFENGSVVVPLLFRALEPIFGENH